MISNIYYANLVHVKRKGKLSFYMVSKNVPIKYVNAKTDPRLFASTKMFTV